MCYLYTDDVSATFDFHFESSIAFDSFTDASFRFSSYDRDETELVLDSERHLIKLHDTAGQEDYERLRQVIYKEVRFG